MSASRINIGVIGARRVRHGIGPFVAAHLSQLGANVAAIAGTSAQSVSLARQELQSLAGISPRGYASVAEMFATEQLDAVAICSPDAAHADQLRMALGAGLHVLCEKPLIFDGQSNPAEKAAALIDQFSERGLVLAVNEQWPYTLPAFDKLFPDVRRTTPSDSFRMLLCPGATGVEMIPNSLPHVLSMLFALHGEAAAETASLEKIEATVTARNDRDEVSGAQIEFVFCSQAAGAQQATDVVVELHFAATPPRPAAYAIDGRSVNRVIRNPGYKMLLESLDVAGSSDLFSAANNSAGNPNNNSVHLEDPLRLLLADFLAQCQRPTPPANIAAARSLQLLWQIYQAAPANNDFTS